MADVGKSCAGEYKMIPGQMCAGFPVYAKSDGSAYRVINRQWGNYWMCFKVIPTRPCGRGFYLNTPKRREVEGPWDNGFANCTKYVILG